MKLRKQVRHEIIGLKVNIIEARNETLKGIKGRVVDETRNTLSIDTINGLRKILKKNITLLIKTKEGEVKVPGEALIGRPEKRIKRRKKLVKRW